MKAPILTMIGIKDEEELEKYSMKMKNAIIKESVDNLKRLNSNAAFVYGLTPEEDEMLVRNIQRYIDYKNLVNEAYAKGYDIDAVKVAINMLNENQPIDMIIKATWLTEENLEIIK